MKRIFLLMIYTFLFSISLTACETAKDINIFNTKKEKPKPCPVIKILKDANKSFVFRPHYMSILKNELDIEALDLNDSELDIKPNLEFDNYSNLISDWSGIYLEFAFLNKKNLF